MTRNKAADDDVHVVTSGQAVTLAFRATPWPYKCLFLVGGVFGSAGAVVAAIPACTVPGVIIGGGLTPGDIAIQLAIALLFLGGSIGTLFAARACLLRAFGMRVTIEPVAISQGKAARIRESCSLRSRIAVMPCAPCYEVVDSRGVFGYSLSLRGGDGRSTRVGWTVGVGNRSAATREGARMAEKLARAIDDLGM